MHSRGRSWGGGAGALEGDKQQRQALVGQSHALLIVSVLIESHNEMSGAGIILGCRPAATGFPYMETQLILDLLFNPGRILPMCEKRVYRRRMAAGPRKCILDNLSVCAAGEQMKLINNLFTGYIKCSAIVIDFCQCLSTFLKVNDEKLMLP